MSDTRYLKQRKRTWYLQVAVPRYAQAVIGKAVIVRSLKTDSLREAQQRRIAALAEVHQWFQSARDAPADWSTPTNILKAARFHRSEIQNDGRSLDNTLWNWDEGSYAQQLDNPQLKQELVTAMATGRKIIEGDKVAMLSDAIEDHLTEIAPKVLPQTLNSRRRRLEGFKDHVGDMEMSTLTRFHAGSYISKKLIPMDRAIKTRQNILIDLKAFGSWCEQRGYLESNPFAGQQITDTKRGTREKVESKRRAWSDAELSNLVKALPGEGNLLPLTEIAMYSGMRLNEICELEIANVHHDADVPYFDLVQGKTESSIRRVPIHSEILSMVKKLVSETQDGYLLSGLKPGGENKRRGHNMSKKFGYLIRKHVTKDKRLVFHSLRKSFLTALEKADVAVSTAELIVGHRRQSLSYGLYSDGVNLETLTDAVEKVSY